MVVMVRPTVAPGRAPTRIVALRILVLARLLTTATGVLAAVAYVGSVTYLAITPGDDEMLFARWLLDWWLWVLIFTFWVALMYLTRRSLRLDTLT